MRFNGDIEGPEENGAPGEDAIGGAFDPMPPPVRLLREPAPAATVSSVRSPIERVWPPSPASGVGGNTLGFLGALSHDASQPLEIPFGGPVYAIALDPEWTSPAAHIGMSFGGSSPLGSTHTMRPGDVVEIPQGVDRCWIHNADTAPVFLALSGNRGYVSFLVSRAPGILPRFASRVPHPLARAIGFARSDVLATLFTSGIRRLLIDAYPLTAAFALTTTRPWSCRVKIFPYARLLTAGAWSIGSFDAETAGNPVPNESEVLENFWAVALGSGGPGAADAYVGRASLDLSVAHPLALAVQIDSIEDAGQGAVAAVMLGLRGEP